MIGIANAKDWERCWTDRIARAPGESERAAFGVDISGRPVRHQLAVRTLESIPLCAVGNNLYVTEKVRVWISTGCIVGCEFMIAGEIEQQPAFGCAGKA